MVRPPASRCTCWRQCQLRRKHALGRRSGVPKNPLDLGTGSTLHTGNAVEEKEMKQLLFVFAAVAGLFAQQAVPPDKHESMDPKSCPMHAEHMKELASAADQRFAEMNARGDQS